MGNIILEEVRAGGKEAREDMRQIFSSPKAEERVR